MSVDILIPTLDNRPYLEPCIRSIRHVYAGAAARIVVINNGQPGSLGWLDPTWADVLEPGENLGWTGGLAFGLERTAAPYVLFLNDDTLVPPCSVGWLAILTAHAGRSYVGAVGPSSNCCSGPQSIWAIDGPDAGEVPFLTGFCMLVRRDALVAAGGVDQSLPGGDDIDLCIRLRKNSWALWMDKGVFVYHHGFVTGTKVYGPAGISGGWNSREYARATADALVRKHGREAVLRIGMPVGA